MELNLYVTYTLAYKIFEEVDPQDPLLTRCPVITHQLGIEFVNKKREINIDMGGKCDAYIIGLNPDSRFMVYRIEGKLYRKIGSKEAGFAPAMGSFSRVREKIRCVFVTPWDGPDPKTLRFEILR